ncbi:hypothetical protein, partial [Thermococcus sp.]
HVYLLIKPELLPLGLNLIWVVGFRKHGHHLLGFLKMEYPQKGGLKILAKAVPKLRLTQEHEKCIHGLKSA